MGCDRQMMIAAMFVGFGLFVALSSVTVGLVTFFCFSGLAGAKPKTRRLFGLSSTRAAPATNTTLPWSAPSR